MNRKPKTRSDTEKFLIGQPSDLSRLMLPTNKDILCYVEYKWQISCSQNQNVKKASLFSSIANDVTEIWESASLPVMGMKQICNKISRLVERYVAANKDQKKKNSEKVQALKKELFILFDICGCFCFKPLIKEATDQSILDVSACSCESKIPLREWDFYLDQMSERKLVISASVDTKATTEMREAEARLTRKRLRLAHRIKAKENGLNQSDQMQNNWDCSDAEPIIKRRRKMRDDVAFEINESESRMDEYDRNCNKQKQNRYQYPHYVSAATRFGVGRRAACALANALLQDMSIPTIPLLQINFFSYNFSNRPNL